MRHRRIAVITSHPIQYQAPWFRALAAHSDLDIQVYFCHKATRKEQALAGFGVEFDWDIPLTDGYSYQFLKNVAARPSIRTFNGLDVPEIWQIVAREKYDAMI